MNMPIAWTIGGSDTGGGAGIQADLKTMNALGVHGCSVVTALTAQNTVGVIRIEPVSIDMVQAQLTTLAIDLPPRAIKFGMLYSENLINAVADYARSSDSFLICDPVLSATTGSALTEHGALASLRTSILPYCHLLTPNLPEAHQLLDRQFDKSNFKHMDERAIDEYIENLAFDLLKLGPESVLLKGGHRSGEYSQDFWTDGWHKAWFTSARCDSKNSHGTGCTLSSAIAACVASGHGLTDSIVIAKAYVNQGLRCAPDVGEGCGPLAHLGWPESETDIPWVTRTAQLGRERPQFNPDKEIGFYPIVDRAHWIEKLATVGVRTIQLRIKDLPPDLLEQEICRAANIARQRGCNLYVNDHWQLAIKYNAYGVHLGQQDLDSANVCQIQDAGLKLGISTHSYMEVARALGLRPSYIAIGPIFPTTTKSMRYNPQGIEQLMRWRRSLRYPLVAIGGLSLSHAREILDGGVESIAVVRDIMQAENPAERAFRWVRIFGQEPSIAMPADAPIPALATR